MKPIALVLLVFAAGAMLPGCPIYGSDEGCIYDTDCPTSYVCDGTLGLCRPQSDLSCTKPSDCGSATCTRDGVCRRGDCSWAENGCVAGYVCSRGTGVWECVPRGSQSGEGGSGGSDSAAEGGAASATGGTSGAGGAI